MIASPPNYRAMSQDELIGVIETQKKALNYRDEKLKWYEGILSNKALPINQRLAVIASKRIEETRKPGDDGYYRAHLPALADMVGVSPSTMSRGLKSLVDCTDALEHRTEHDKHDPYKSIVFIRPTDLLARPHEIVPVKEIKRHGGDHRIFCQSCGSEDIVEKKQHICRGCGEVVKTFDLREINAPLQDATGMNEQEETAISADMSALEDISDKPSHCNLQPLLTHTVSHCTLLSALDELKALPIWVCWRYEDDEKGKLTKVPYNAETLVKASSTNPKTWRPYDQAQAMYERSQSYARPFTGIGFMCNGDYTVIDQDHCITDSVISDEAQARVVSVNSYTEISYSGTGLHTITRGSITKGVKRAIEMYCKGRFMVFTGNHLAGTPLTIEDRQPVLDALYAELVPPVKEPINVSRVIHSPCSRTDSEILDKARNGKNGAQFEALWNGTVAPYASQSEADLALCNHLAYWTDNNVSAINRLFRQSGLFRDKWDRSVGGGETYGERTIRLALVKEWMAS